MNFIISLGWGTTSYSGQASEVLLEVILPIWALADCQKTYTQPISDKQLCAGYKAGGKDSCQVGKESFFLAHPIDCR